MFFWYNPWIFLYMCRPYLRQILIFIWLSLAGNPLAEAALVFTTEDNGTHDQVFYIDSGDTSADFIDLEFGTSVDAKLRYDVINDNFELNRDTNFGGNEVTDVRVENAGSAPTCDGTRIGRLYYDTGNSSIYVCDGSNWNSLDKSTVLIDEDDNTQIQVEEGVDDNTIRFDTAGVERGVFGSTGNFTLNNSAGTAEVITFNQGKGSSSSAPDIQFGTDGLLVAESDLVLNIDSDNSETTANLRIMHNANNTTTATELARLDEAGNFGLGVDPTSDLHIRKVSGNTQILLETNVDIGSGNDTSLFFTSDADGTPNSAGLGQFNDGALRFTGAGNLAVPDVIIDDAGEVGVGGLTDPQAQLHIQHSGSALRFERTGYDTYEFQQSLGTGLAIQNITDAQNELFFTGNGSIVVNGTAETIDSDGGAFVLDGGDLFVADELGVEGAIYTDDTATKYQFVEMHGCVRGSANAGTVAGGNAPVVRFDGTNNSQMRCSLPVPDDWVAGTDINIETYWSPSDNTSGAVDFDLEYALFAVGETVATGSFVDTILGTTYETVNLNTQLDIYEMVANIPSADIALDDMISFNLHRTPADAGDTYGGDVNIHMIRMAYTGKKLK